MADAKTWTCQFCDVVATSQSNAKTHLISQHAVDVTADLTHRLKRARRKLARLIQNADAA